jgi:hypothetical protein
MLEDGHPDTMFMLNWANEPWTRNWDGQDRAVLVPQHYGGPEQWTKHFEYLMQYFLHPNYIRVDGCPLFGVYRPTLNATLIQIFDHWRAMARRTPGIGCLLIMGSFVQEYPGLRFDSREGQQFINMNLDALGEFEPHRSAWDPNLFSTFPRIHRKSHYYSLMAGWDDAPRRFNTSQHMDPDPHVFLDQFSDALRRASDRTVSDPNPRGDNFVLINAWNEWGEGNVMEPNSLYGRKLLEAHMAVMQEFANPVCPSKSGSAVAGHVGHKQRQHMSHGLPVQDEHRQDEGPELRRHKATSHRRRH